MKQQSEASGFRTWVTSVVGVSIALSSLALASYQACETRKAQRVAVTPRMVLDFRRTEGENAQATIAVLNVGIGPAEVKALNVTLDGKDQASWSALLIAIGAYQTQDLTYARFPSGTFYKAGYEGTLIKVTGAQATDAFRRAFDRRLRFTMCYCSFYEECWQFDLPHYATTAVESCQAPKHEMDRLAELVAFAESVLALQQVTGIDQPQPTRRIVLHRRSLLVCPTAGFSRGGHIVASAADGCKPMLGRT